MGKKNKKRAESVALQLISLCKDDDTLMKKAEIVKQEFYRVIEIESMISHQPQKMLNKVLHSTRAMDAGMRTFLELFDAMPSGHNYAMGPYLQ